jgi:YD repeat-containing protein
MKNTSFLRLCVLAAIVLLLAPLASAQTTYRYDAANRLIGAVYADGQSLDFAYDNNGNLLSVTRTGDVPPGPIVNVQPVYHPVGVGDTLTLSIAASGSGLSFQWYKDGVLLVGETDATLVLAGLDLDDAGSYYCIVTDGLARTATSDSVYVQVLDDGVDNLWKSALKLAPGSRFYIYAFEVPSVGGAFAAKPKISAETLQPLNGKMAKAKPKLLSKPSTDDPLAVIACVWGKSICLYDKKGFSSYYKRGLGGEEFLADNPMPSALIYVTVQNGKNVPTYLSRFFNLVPPQITELRNQADTPITSLAAGQTFKIVGRYFGEKPPKIWVEYGTAKGARGKLSLKVDKVLLYVGAGGKPSCMDPDTGESLITAILPAKLKAEMSVDETYHLILDNGQGFAICPFTLE